MTNDVTLIRFTLDAMCAWVQARDDEPAYKVCMASKEQTERVKADAGLCLRPFGKNVRVCKVKTN